MSENRPYVICISGHDPSGGAGLLADVKTMEMHRVQGLAICSAITFQNEDEFIGLDWVNEEQVHRQLDVLLKQYQPKALKIGIIESFALIDRIINQLKSKLPEINIVWDPILEASAGFSFQEEIDKESFFSILSKIDLITPNIPECKCLFGTSSLQEISKICTTSILLKGGHSDGEKSVDQLLFKGELFQFEHQKKEGFSKHGTGCILSSAIASNLALGNSMIEACCLAKEYIQPILTSNNTRLAYHYE